MNNKYINKSKLVKKLRCSQLSTQQVDFAVTVILKTMANAIKKNKRIEIRGFGSFSIHEHKNKIVKNPKTGEVLPNMTQYKIHFKPGKDLREQVLKLK